MNYGSIFQHAKTRGKSWRWRLHDGTFAFGQWQPKKVVEARLDLYERRMEKKIRKGRELDKQTDDERVEL